MTPLPGAAEDAASHESRKQKRLTPARETLRSIQSFISHAFHQEQPEMHPEPTLASEDGSVWSTPSAVEGGCLRVHCVTLNMAKKTPASVPNSLLG